MDTAVQRLHPSARPGDVVKPTYLNERKHMGVMKYLGHQLTGHNYVKDPNTLSTYRCACGDWILHL